MVGLFTSSLRLRVAVAGALLVGILGAALAAFAWSSDARSETSRSERVADEVAASAADAERDVLDIESGLRGHALTGDRRFLEPLRAGRRRLGPDLDALRKAAADDPALVPVAARLVGDTRAYLRDDVAPRLRAPSGGAGGARGAVHDRPDVDRLRAEFAVTERIHRERSGERSVAAETDARRARLFGIAALLGALALLASLLVSLSRWVTQPVRRVAAAAERVAAGELETEVPEDGAGEIRVLARAFNAMTADLRAAHGDLEERVAARTQQVEATRLETLELLARMAEFRDDDTQRHAQRIGRLAGEVGRALGFDDETVADLRSAAPLHDVGKVAIPDAILRKPGRLTEDEFAVVRLHTTVGAQILSASGSPVLRMAQQVALTHHERWDGTGYPARLAGEEIPLVGRIVAVVDVFDALVNERPYKRAWSREDAIAEIRAGAGTHFDPAVVGAFLSVIEASDGPTRLALGGAPVAALA